jgi:hypothetical protein
MGCNMEQRTISEAVVWLAVLLASFAAGTQAAEGHWWATVSFAAFALSFSLVAAGRARDPGAGRSVSRALIVLGVAAAAFHVVQRLT